MKALVLIGGAARGVYAADNAPIGQAIAAGATEVSVSLLQHSGLRYRERKIRSLGDIGFIVHDVVQEHILELEPAFIRAMNDQERFGIAPPSFGFVDVRVIGPSVPLRSPALPFGDQASIDRVYKWGVADGQAAQSVRRLS